jgi:hypothetical protein
MRLSPSDEYCERSGRVPPPNILLSGRGDRRAVHAGLMGEASTSADAPVVNERTAETAAEGASGELEEGEVAEVAAAEAVAVVQGAGTHTAARENTPPMTEVSVERSVDEPLKADVAAAAPAEAAGTPARGTGRRKRGGAVAAKPNKTMLSFGDELEEEEDGEWGKMAGASYRRWLRVCQPPVHVGMLSGAASQPPMASLPASHHHAAPAVPGLAGAASQQ